jgi:hypothetical protein
MTDLHACACCELLDSCRLPRCARSVAWYDWHYSGTVAVCSHVLQVLNALPARMSYMSMMTLMSDVLEICLRALETYGPNCIVRSARFFFMLEAHGPQGVEGDAVAAPEPSRQGGRIRWHSTHGDARALPIREAGSRATGYEVTPEPSLAERQGPEPLDMWRRQSPSYQEDSIRSHWTHDDAEALPIRKAGSEATEYVATTYEHCWAHDGAWVHAPIPILI